jgi:hypothetical protein
MDQIAVYQKGGIAMNKAVRTALIVASSLVLAGALLIGAAFALGVRPEDYKGDDISDIFHRLFGGTVTIGVGPGNYRDWKNEYSAGGDYSLPAEGIKSLNILWIAGNVDVEVWDGKDIEFSESAIREISQDAALRFGTEEGVLYIQYRAAAGEYTPSVFPEKRLQLRIPRSLAGSLEEFSFEGSSSSLRADGLTADVLHLMGVSGEIQVSGRFETLDVQSTSGAIRIENAGTAKSAEIGSISGEIGIKGAFEKLDLHSTSGGIRSTGTVSAGSLTCGSVSGSIELEGSFDKVVGETSSGSVDIRSSLAPVMLDISSISGDVALVIPPDSGFTLEYSSISGGFQCDFSVLMQEKQVVAGDGAGKYHIDTASGSIRISPTF